MSNLLEKLEHRESQITDNNITGYLVIFSIFITGLVTNFIIAGKVVDFYGFIVPASAFIWALTFPCSDIVAEVYGVKYARKMVMGGFVAFCLAFLIFQFALWLKPADFWQGQDNLEQVLSTSFRVMFASVISYIVAQTFDVYAFGYLRKFFNGKYLWLRNNVSTMASQTLSNILFLSIAFLGQFDMDAWWALFFGNLTMRYILAFSDTAIVYTGVYGLYKLYPELNDSFKNKKDKK